MPTINYYEVTQTRRVKVTANNEVEAIQIADAGFKNGQNSDNGVRNGPEGIWGNSTSAIEVIDVSVSKNYF